MFIYRKDKRKFKWLIFSFILFLSLGSYGLVFAYEDDFRQIEAEQAFARERMEQQRQSMERDRHYMEMEQIQRESDQMWREAEAWDDQRDRNFRRGLGLDY